MQLQYKKVLIIGATSGLGWALAERFVETGTSVIIVGRREERLQEFKKQHDGGNATIDTAKLDITDFKAIPGFAKEQFEKHPDIDCVFLNSGLQRKVDWSKPESVDLDTIEMEMVTNYTSYMHLTKAFLPLLQKQAPKETGLIFTTSGLALVPILHCPNYCATKAALHHMILAMREQLKMANSNVKIIEILPPAVQTELHDHEYGDKGRDMGMSLKDFVNESFEGLCSKDNEQIPVQAAKTFMGFNSWEQERQKTMHTMIERMKQQSS